MHWHEQRKYVVAIWTYANLCGNGHRPRNWQCRRDCKGWTLDSGLVDWTRGLDSWIGLCWTELYAEIWTDAEL